MQIYLSKNQCPNIKLIFKNFLFVPSIPNANYKQRQSVLIQHAKNKESIALSSLNFQQNVFRCIQENHFDHFDQTEDIESFLERFQEQFCKNPNEKQKNTEINKILPNLENQFVKLIEIKDQFQSKMNKFTICIEKLIKQLQEAKNSQENENTLKLFEINKHCDNFDFIENAIKEAVSQPGNNTNINTKTNNITFPPEKNEQVQNIVRCIESLISKLELYLEGLDSSIQSYDNFSQIKSSKKKSDPIFEDFAQQNHQFGSNQLPDPQWKINQLGEFSKQTMSKQQQMDSVCNQIELFESQTTPTEISKEQFKGTDPRLNKIQKQSIIVDQAEEEIKEEEIIHTSSDQCNALIEINGMLAAAFGHELRIFKQELNPQTQQQTFIQIKIFSTYHDQDINFLLYLPTKNSLVSCGNENCIKFINANKFANIQKIQFKQNETIPCLLFLEQFDWLLIPFGSTIKIVEVKENEEKLSISLKNTLTHNQKITALCSLQNSQFIIGDMLGRIGFIQINEKETKIQTVSPALSAQIDFLIKVKEELLVGSKELDSIKLFGINYVTFSFIQKQEIKFGQISGINNLINTFYFTIRENTTMITKRYQLDSKQLSVVDSKEIPKEFLNNNENKTAIQAPIIFMEKNKIIRATGNILEILCLDK